MGALVLQNLQRALGCGVDPRLRGVRSLKPSEQTPREPWSGSGGMSLWDERVDPVSSSGACQKASAIKLEDVFVQPWDAWKKNGDMIL